MAANSGNGPTLLPLVAPLQSRNGATRSDSYISNGIVEKDLDGQIRLYKRPSVFGPLTSGPVSGTGQGIYYWRGDLYNIQSGNLYRNNVLVGAVGAGSFWFRETLGTPSYLYLSNGSAAFYVTSAGVFAAITDAVYTGTIVSTVRGAAYLDGTLYVMDVNAQIWGSKNLNDPTTWDALNMIRAQMEPDRGVAIAKQDIYVVAIKRWTTEFFYDAANPTGSPLLPVQNAKLSVGCYDAKSLASVDDILFWVSVNRGGELHVVRCEKAQYKIISTADIARILNHTPFTVESSWALRYDGRLLYGLKLFLSGPSPTYTTLVFDEETGNWCFWDFDGGEFPFNFFAPPEGGDRFGLGSVSLNCAFQGRDGTVYYLLAGDYLGDTKDGGVTRKPVKLEIVTPLFDGGTRLEKIFSRMLLQCDQASAGLLEVCWSDDDYQTWSSWVAIPLTSSVPQINDLGSARKRAFRFRHQSPTFVRLLAAELDVLVGSV